MTNPAVKAAQISFRVLLTDEGCRWKPEAQESCFEERSWYRSTCDRQSIQTKLNVRKIQNSRFRCCGLIPPRIAGPCAPLPGHP